MREAEAADMRSSETELLDRRDHQRLGDRIAVLSGRAHFYEGHPMTTVNPDEASAPRPLTSDGLKIQTNIATFANIIAGDGEC